MESRFEEAILALREIGYEGIAGRLQKELDVYNAETYKIAVVGEFKAGKSTLINHVFLKEDALFTDVMEATAVPTEIHYGQDKTLEVVRTSDKVNRKPVRITDPTIQDIEKYTSAHDPETRARLARSTARVILTWPATNLAGLTLFDTPGINSLNEAVIETTYRIIPESDIVLFVTNAKQLSHSEMEFLSGRVFSEGITRAIIVVSYHPDSELLSDGQKQELVRCISSQLSEIGRESVPVELVDLEKDLAASKISLKDRVEAETIEEPDVRKIVDDVIGNLLISDKPAPKSPKETIIDGYGIPEFEEKLIRFIRKNVRPARIEKAKKVLKNQIQLSLIRCTTEMGALKKTETERQQMLEDVLAKENKIRREYETLSSKFMAELKIVQKEFTHDIHRGLDHIATTYISGFDDIKGIGEIQSRLNRAEIILKGEIEKLFLQHTQIAKEKIDYLTQKYDAKTQVLMNPWPSDVGRGMAIDGGTFANIPPFAVLTVDFGLFILFGPFGPLSRLLVRLLIDNVPFLNKILPANLAGEAIKKNIADSMQKEFDIIKQELPRKIDDSFNALSEKLLDEWKKQTEEQLDAIRTSIENSVGRSDDIHRLDSLNHLKKTLDAIQVRI